MRTHTSCLAIALLTAPAVWASAAGPVELLTNGGFEQGLEGWLPDPAHQLVQEPAQACSGKACLSGELKLPNRALKLRRSVPVKASCRYDFQISARGTKGTKLVLFVTPSQSGQRRSVQAWPDLPPKWRRFETSVEVKADGMLELELIAPSSYGAEPGRIWIDDISLQESPLPNRVSASTAEGFNDEAAMAQADDGSLYVAWNSFRDGADSLQVARYQSSGKELTKIAAWQVLGGPGTYLLGVRAVSAGPQVFVVYAAEIDRNWDIFAVPCGAQGPGQPIRVSRGAEVDIKPSAAWHQGRLWIAWESNSDSWRQICATSVVGDRVQTPTRLTGAGASNYAPAIAATKNGLIAVAWHSFRDNNFDLYWRQCPASGSWQPERRLTRAPTIDRHATLLAQGDDLWLLYENALMGAAEIDQGPRTNTYAVGSTRTRRLIVSKVGPHGLLTPKDYRRTAPIFKTKSEAPAAAFDRAGRLWVVYRTPGAISGSGKKAKPREWIVSATCFDGEQWSPPMVVSARKGMDRCPGLVLTERQAIVAYQADDTPTRWTDVDQSKTLGRSEVFLASFDLAPPATVTPFALESLAEPEEPFAPGVVRVQRGEDSPTPSITYRGEKLNLYFGDLHDHTDISICNRVGDESVDESYANMRDLVRHDFACVTDHGYNQNPYLWSYTAKLARVNDDPGRFLTFLGEEWTSSIEEYSAEHPYGFYGHRNLIFEDAYFPRWWNAVNRQTPAQVWEELRKMKANFVNIPHQLADTGNVPTDWNYTDETAQPVAEIFQGRGSYEHRGTPREAHSVTPQPGYFLQDAWARGIVIGVIASPDHTGGYGKACVFAPALNRAAILDAIRSRRCYGTTAAKILLDVRVNEHLMGEKITTLPQGPVTVKILARCPADIDRVEVCRNNQFIYTTNPEGPACELTFVDREPLAGRSYYYVRVMQKDGEIAWSSPVWFAPQEQTAYK